MILLRVLVLILALFIASCRPVEAYLDPGTGSIVLQVILAVILGSLAGGKTIFSLLKQRLTIKKRSKPKPPTDDGPPEELLS